MAELGHRLCPALCTLILAGLLLSALPGTASSQAPCQAMGPQGPGQGALHPKDAHLLMVTNDFSANRDKLTWSRTCLASAGAEGVEGGRHGGRGVGREHSVALAMHSTRGVTGPLTPEHSSVTSIDLFITSWKESFIFQAKLPLYPQHRN